MSGEYVIIDRGEVEEVQYNDDEEPISVTLKVVDGPYSDPHEADFQTRGEWSQDFVNIKEK